MVGGGPSWGRAQVPALPLLGVARGHVCSGSIGQSSPVAKPDPRARGKTKHRAVRTAPLTGRD